MVHREVELPGQASAVLPHLVAECRRETGTCPTLRVVPEDIEIWELNWPGLARNLCRALGFDPRSAEFPLYNTRQIGSWSASAVPVFLSIQTEPEDLRSTIIELAFRLQSLFTRNPFILLSPTAAHLNANCPELLSRANAGFFPLDSTVLVTDHAAFRPARPPGELFAQFNPEPEADNRQLLIAAVALVQRLESIWTKALPTPLNVFHRGYVLQHSNVRIAREFGCARATIGNRLRAIQALLGDKLTGLERYAPEFEKLLDLSSDPRARSIYTKGLFSNDPSPGDASGGDY